MKTQTNIQSGAVNQCGGGNAGATTTSNQGVTIRLTPEQISTLENTLKNYGVTLESFSEMLGNVIV